jgi:hypothetical protein
LQEYVRYTLLRLDAALRQLDASLDQKFPYRDAQEALELIRSVWDGHREALRNSPRTGDTTTSLRCLKALGEIRNLLPIVGWVARCASPRHAFELYGPLKLLARGLLSGPNEDPANSNVRLILSSAWDYKTITTRRHPWPLSDFIFIIFPGYEAANPLLIPLAGHELGHAVWERNGIEQRFWNDYSTQVTKFLIKNRHGFPELDKVLGRVKGIRPAKELLENSNNRVYSEACRIVSRQLEEFFCDFIGFYLFGESYLHAFTYFLSPDFPGIPSQTYPTVLSRLGQINLARERFSKEWGATIYSPLPNLSGQFQNIAHVGDLELIANRSLVFEGIDEIAVSLTDKLREEIVLLANQRRSWKELRNFNFKKRRHIRENCYRWAVPAENCETLPNILNAAWDVERDESFWKSHPALGLQTIDSSNAIEVQKLHEKRREALHELVLKNIEVLEYEYIIRRPITT